MKWLLSLSAAQTVLLAALGLKVFSMDMALDDMAAGAAAQPAETQGAGGPEQLSWDNARTPSMSAAEMRAILKEELAALETAQRSASEPGQPQRPQQAPEQVRQTQAGIQQELNRLRGAGPVFAADLVTVESKIASLPAAERRAALSMLAKAIANGEINARL